MKTTTSTHKIPGYGSTLRTAKRLTEQAARLVNRSVPGTMCDVEVILTNERGMADLMTAADIALAGSADRRALQRAQRDAKRTARNIQAAAIPRPDGSALVLINADRHPTPAEFAVTLVHELVHVMQFSRKNVRERIVADLRDRLGIERQSRRHAREFERALEQDEREAYGREHLAAHLVPSAAAA
ncbi:hypothetical protein I2W78_21490 [Streptomyces spinoverrucosus]|uniref:hypothetical protein n=1 Tax=Streptomyces spinoverrucosus TaxID=284043 RepID=UPI0018C439B9|nr:hypothetical protein [Streptomyces spinoverrucosus]MBG0854339.1 hypothetical protein [Streptomyces spinoverrucosus]